MAIVMTHGTFDLLHYGHIKYLEKAKALGDFLIVLVTSDKKASEYFKKNYYNEKIRMDMVSSLKSVDKVILRDYTITEKIIKKYHVDIFVSTNDGYNKYDYLKEYCSVVYLDRVEGISTSKIKKDLSSFWN